jgi:hypothetical protein
MVDLGKMPFLTKDFAKLFRPLTKVYIIWDDLIDAVLTFK